MQTDMDEFNLEHLHCSLCTGYLSFAPIQVLPDGSSFCGRCTLTDDEVLTYRNFALETVLSETVFPCRYEMFGCKERLLFGQAEEHEVACDYRCITCPILPSGSCLWEGPALTVRNHFIVKHPECIMENAEVKIQIDKDVQGLLLVEINDFIFIVSYKYSASTSSLQHDVRYFTHNVQKAAYKVRLFNDLDRDYCVVLKGRNCEPYNTHVNCAVVLSVNNYLQNLNNPRYITLAVDLNIISKTNVDYAVLQAFTLRCKDCRGYLIPPLFECEQGVICCNCYHKYQNCTPSTDYELKDLLAKTNFPCHWRGCDFVGKIESYKKHVTSCQFRVYECICLLNCIKFTRQEAIAHIQNHEYEYFAETYVFKMVFDNNEAPIYTFTIKDDEVILFNYETYEEEGVKEKRLMPIISRNDFNIYCLQIEFGHSHCKMKSPTYTLEFSNSSYGYWIFVMRDLPSCFQPNEELMVTLRI